MDNQVFQQTSGEASFTAEWNGDADNFQLKQGATVIDESPVGAFVDVPAGWYQIAMVRDGDIIDLINVGVGDVFVVAGQSNSVSQVQPEGFTPAVPSGPGKVILNRYYYGGLRDVYDDPLETYLFDTGVAWLYAALDMDRAYPVMFIMVGLGNTTTGYWTSPSIYQRIINAVDIYGPKAVLWHQGESDCTVPPVAEATSYANMETMIDGVYAETTVPWVMAINSTSSMAPVPFSEWPIRAAQQDIIDNYAHVLQGPDSDTVRVSGEVEYLGSSLQDHGELWATTLDSLGL